MTEDISSGWNWLPILLWKRNKEGSEPPCSHLLTKEKKEGFCLGLGEFLVLGKAFLLCLLIIVFLHRYRHFWDS